MFEIKMVNIYLKKLWIILFFILVYQFAMMIIFIKAVNNLGTDIDAPITRWTIHNIRNFDLILLGIFVFPIIIRFIKENEFYKNYILKNQSSFKSNLIIIFYFLLLMFIIASIKKVIFYSIDYSLITKKNWDYPIINFELAFFADLHLVVSSLFIGKMLSILPIRKNSLFYPILILITFFAFLLIAISLPIFLLRLGEKQSTDIFSRQTINMLKALKSIVILGPLTSWIGPNQVAGVGGFYYFLNYNSLSENLDRAQLDYSVAIWIIVSFFVYIMMIILASFLNKPMRINLKNKINFQRFTKTNSGS